MSSSVALLALSDAEFVAFRVGQDRPAEPHDVVILDPAPAKVLDPGAALLLEPQDLTPELDEAIDVFTIDHDGSDGAESLRHASSSKSRCIRLGVGPDCPWYLLPACAEP